VFKEHEQDLISHELQIHELIFNLDQMEKLQLEQNKNYKEGLVGLNDTIEV
jgi:hypothetical protein